MNLEEMLQAHPTPQNPAARVHPQRPRLRRRVRGDGQTCRAADRDEPRHLADTARGVRRCLQSLRRFVCTAPGDARTLPRLYGGVPGVRGAVPRAARGALGQRRSRQRRQRERPELHVPTPLELQTCLTEPAGKGQGVRGL